MVSADVSAKKYSSSNENSSTSYPLDVHTIYVVKLAGGAAESGVEQPPSYLATTMFEGAYTSASQASATPALESISEQPPSYLAAINSQLSTDL